VVNKGSPQGEDHEEADQLLQIVRAQVVTQNSVLEAAPERQRPGAVQNESQSPGVAPLGELKKLVAAVQSTDFLSQRLMKEVQGVVNACAHYSLSPEGILLWKEKLMFHSREVGSMNY
jgi:hypothetical protein